MKKSFFCFTSKLKYPSVADIIYDQVVIPFPFSAPKEKPCCTLPTVKKLLEEKRRRETSSVPPSCTTASTSPVPTTTVTVRQRNNWLSTSLNMILYFYTDMIVYGFSIFLPLSPSSCLHQNNLPVQVRLGQLPHTQRFKVTDMAIILV